MNSDNYDLLNDTFAEIVDLDIPIIAKRRKNIFEISGYPHYENVFSNILAFYLDKNEEHNFGSLFLDSLLEITGREDFRMLDWKVKREKRTHNNNFIDILITSSNEDEASYIIIENKLYHTVSNPFEDYWNSVNASKHHKLGILFTLEKVIEPPNNFVNVQHDYFLQKVVENLSNCFLECDDRHLLFLKDFYLNLKFLKGEYKEMNDQLRFYLTHGEKFEQLNSLRNEIIKNISESIKNLVLPKIETRKRGRSNDKLEIYNYIDGDDDTGKVWILINLRNFLRTKTIVFNISCYTKEINLDEILSNIEFQQILERSSIAVLGFNRSKFGEKLLKKEYQLSEEESTNVQNWVINIYETDWLPIVEFLLSNLRYT